MMDDSDSEEDDLLDLPVFYKRKECREDRRRSKAIDFLDNIIDENKRRLCQIHRENDSSLDDQEFLSKAEEKVKSISKKPRRESNGFADDALEQARQKELSDDDTFLTTQFGFRNTIFFNRNRHSGPLYRFYTSEDEAVNDLRQFSEEAQADEVAGKLLSVLEVGVLWDFIEEGCLHKLLVDQQQLSGFHYKLFRWLVNVAQSSGLGNATTATLLTDHATNALETILSLRRHGKITAGTFNATLDKFYKNLDCWVDLNCSRKPCGTTITSPKSKRQAHPVRNIPGLLNMLSIWESLIPCLPFCATTATKCMVSLARLGTDKATSSASAAFQLREKLQNAIVSLLDLTASRQGFANEEKLLEWMKITATAILNDLSDLGPGETGSDDLDHKNAWLCRPATVYLIPMLDKQSSIHKSSCQLKALVALEALQACLGTNDITKKIETVLSESGNRGLFHRAASSLGWLAVCGTVATFIDLASPDNVIAEDGPRLLATVFCAILSFETGMILMKCTVTGTAVAEEYGTREQADAADIVLNILSNQCDKLSRELKHSKSMMANDFYRWADSLLDKFRQYTLKTISITSRLSGKLDSSPVQKNIDSFFKANRLSPNGE